MPWQPAATLLRMAGHISWLMELRSLPMTALLALSACAGLFQDSGSLTDSVDELQDSAVGCSLTDPIEDQPDSDATTACADLSKATAVAVDNRGCVS